IIECNATLTKSADKVEKTERKPRPLERHPSTVKFAGGIVSPWNPTPPEPRVQPERGRIPNCRLRPCPCSLPLMLGAFFAGAPAAASPATRSTAGSTLVESAPCAWDSASLSPCPCSKRLSRNVWTGREFERRVSQHGARACLPTARFKNSISAPSG